MVLIKNKIMMKTKNLTTVIFFFFLLLSRFSAMAQESNLNEERTLLASSSKRTELSPATDLTPQEIERIINRINPYTLFRKGSIAEYAFEKDGKQMKFLGGPTYIQEVVVDEKIEDGLLVAYTNSLFFNKKHTPLKGLDKSLKEQLFPTTIDTAGTYYFTHNIHQDCKVISKRQGFAMVIPSNMKVGDNISCNSITDLCKNGFGMEILKFTTQYSDFTVEKEESVTTPAGAFDCVKLTGWVHEGRPGKDFKYHYSMWLARGIGIVKLEILTEKEKRKNKPPFIIYLNHLELK